MTSDAKNVTEYIKNAPTERQAALTKLRRLCKENLKGYKEEMAYGGPAYSGNNGIVVGFASQKNYVGFYCLVHEVMLANKELLEGLNHGKGVIRFSNPDKIDFTLVEKILKDTFNSVENPC